MFLIFIIFFFTPIITFSQINLIVEIAPLRNNDGQVFLELNDENEEIIKGYSEKIVNNKCIVVLEKQ